ncbi:arginine N-succinyltransferase [Aliamphritea spongicola]|uniref:arginine N-succinyltransferase n=1 Tax=Aliamphritea spongicola TaxID=707589 RepID=UPI00196AA2B5|nr:arginine N-succinyltransferase [Aliamphritea spongicola]MBN3561420.1 arginine N-succinyltransferase [Aliamphritea spongicola]
MLIIRPCQPGDLNDLMHISAVVGRGMTSMPADEAAWKSKIAASQKAFAGKADASSTYFMVLEDNQTGQVVGTTAIYTGIGLSQPFYSYKVSTLVSSSQQLDMIRQAKVLSMVNDYTGATEIGSLFLLPEYRKPGVGKFLSRARFLLMADFPHLFADTVMAELRGWQDENGNSPLWQHLGHKFFAMDFQEAVRTAALEGSQFISDMMPKYPIYIDLLPEAARDVIGKPHDSSAPALNMLKKEGFQFTGYVDLFDGGPSVQIARDEIHTVQESRTAEVTTVKGTSNGQQQEYIISNGELANYRLALTPASIDSKGQLHLAAENLDALQLQEQAQVRYVEARKARPESNAQVA